DLVLWEQILRAVIHAAWMIVQAEASPTAQTTARPAPLVGDGATFLERLRSYRDESGQAFFDSRGNRRRGSGEYVIALEPWRQPNRLTTWSVLEVWHSHSLDNEPRRWALRGRWLLPSDD
ncbi:MAG: hypothetical protein RMJ19_01350, partial [Gemmatales bacterium]|nr:hypothetical protein [Gemmatales bacterium]MDW8174291.1 hypothetical protein [Gemmatales bacterium]